MNESRAEHQYVQISRIQFFALWIGLAVAALLLLMSWFRDRGPGVDVGVTWPPSLGAASSVALFDEKGRINVLDIKKTGRSIEPCEAVQNADIKGCDLKDIDLETINQIEVFSVKPSQGTLCTRQSAKKEVQCFTAATCMSDPSTGKLKCD